MDYRREQLGNHSYNSSKGSTPRGPKNLQKDGQAFAESSMHPLDKSVIQYSSSGFWVQERETEISETPKSSSLRSYTWRERLSQWKLAREKILCGSRNRSHDAKECGRPKEIEHETLEIDSEFRQPLWRKVKIPSSQINPYRVTVILRIVILAFYFENRLLNPVKTAYGLWLTSVFCELWFAISWVFEQLPNWRPVNRETYPERLCLRYNQAGKESQLACIDVFLNTIDPAKQPLLVTANTLLSVLSVDYPPEKISCYVSDDGATLLTLESLSKTCEFARKWVPFCKKFEIEPRSPDCYFSQKVDYLKYNIFPTFAKERRAIKRQYEEFKILINDVVDKFRNVPSDGWVMKDGTPWPGNNTQNHPGMIQILMGRGGLDGYDNKELPQLIYVSREKRPGFQHNKKAGAMNALVRVSAVLTNGAYILNLDCNHYINNSKALLEAMCFMMDPGTCEKICYVQFPQRFDAIDTSDRYANHNTIFYDINMKGLDGIQGPVYVGTGCIFNRKALYGYDPPSVQACHFKYHSTDVSGEEFERLFDNTEPTILGREFPSFRILEKSFGQSTFFLACTLVEDDRYSRSASLDDLLREAIHVTSCDYEDNTVWGREIGWIYGSLTIDILTGFKMHARGWRSIYCMPSVPAFRGSAPINLSDRLSQVLQWALGSVEILFSRHCPLWYGYGGKLKLLERIAYINATVYPISSVPLVVYCSLPAVCLLTGRFITPLFSDATSIWLPLLVLSTLATRVLEMKWSGVGFQEWWRHQQFWVIAGVSSHLFAFFQGLFRVIVGTTTTLTMTSRKFHDDEDYKEFYAFKWTPLLIMPTTLILINLWAMFAGISFALSSDYVSWRRLFSKLSFAFFVIIHLYPFLKGLLVRKHRIPTVIIVWSLLLASLFSVLWVRVNPFSIKYQGPDFEQCGINC